MSRRPRCEVAVSVRKHKLRRCRNAAHPGMLVKCEESYWHQICKFHFVEGSRKFYGQH